MKTRFLFVLYCIAIGLIGCSERTFFSNAGLVYSSIKDRPSTPPELKWSSEGFYRFDICAHDTLFQNTNVQWFCDCTDPKSEGSVDSFAMAFVDEIRVVFFKRPKGQRVINLDKLGKEIKIGVYSWDFQNFNGTQTNPTLVVRVNSPKSGNKENDFSDLFFEVKGKSLALVEMKYFDDDSSITDMTRRKKKSKGSGPLTENPKEGIRTIRPAEVFALSRMLYQFVPKPIVLRFNGNAVQKIEYASDNPSGFVRSTTLKNGTQLLEQSDNQKSIKSW